MVKKAPESLATGAIADRAAGRLEKERAEFNALIAANPNHFGNLVGSDFKAVMPMTGNTKYEELTCIGFNPNLNLLEATVSIKLPTGYGRGLCSAGSTEFVRFFVDYGAGWLDAGMVAVNVHDIPSSADCAGKPDKPLVYVLTQPFEPKRDSCDRPVLPLVRGILSWNAPPPADPDLADQQPVWGNVVERHIQAKPRTRYIAEVVASFGIDPKLKLPPELEAIKDEPIALPDPPPLTLKNLVQLYAQEKAAKATALAKVEPHRFAAGSLKSVLAGGVVDQHVLLAKAAEFKAVGLDLSSILGALETTKGDVTYEELNCLGLDYNRDWLVGTFVIKRPSGYSGNLCSPGSNEYVSFWADWDDTCTWTHVGTAVVPVHDIGTIPASGLHYAAILPVDLSKLRQPCEKPKISRLRAVLSWNVPPSEIDPDAIPHWGNRLDTHVQLKPGQPYSIEPRISILGGIGVAGILTGTTGMTTPGAKFALWDTYADPWDHTRSCPFGGSITVQAPPILGHRYRLWVQNVTTGGPEIQLTEPVWVADQNGQGSYHACGAGGAFDYLPVTANVGSMLYNKWVPAGDDLWQIRLELLTFGGAPVGSTPWHRIQLDNTAPSTVTTPPTLDIHIDSGGDCKVFTIGDEITGRFVARDIHFGRYELTTLPGSLSPTRPSPASGESQTAAFPGNVWSLDTDAMAPCGYVVQLKAWDRTIRNSVPGQHNYNQDDVGFCLKA